MGYIKSNTKRIEDLESRKIVSSPLDFYTSVDNTGIVLENRDHSKYGDIGNNAIDLSYPAEGGHRAPQIGATGEGSFAIGKRTTAEGLYSYAQGFSTKAVGSYSHAEGNQTIANASASHAEGYITAASGIGSHAEGYGTVALNKGSHAEGTYNIGSSTETIHETGTGTDEYNRKNAFEIYINGRLRAPELTIALHDDPKSLTTKEYVDTAITNAEPPAQDYEVDNYFVASQDQTNFVLDYDANKRVQVFVNGLKLWHDVYVSTSGTEVVFNTPASEGDKVNIVSFSNGII